MFRTKSSVAFVAREQPFVGVFAAIVVLHMGFLHKFHCTLRARVRTLASVRSTVFVQDCRVAKCPIAFFASMHLLMHCTFVLQHIALPSELLLAPVNVARVRLRKCVHDAVFFESCLVIELLLA
jgi:hypothetical protein